MSRPNLSFNPGSLTFSFVPGGAVPPCQAVSLRHLRRRPSRVFYRDYGRVALATPASGNAPGSATVCVDPTNLPNGTQTGIVYLLGPLCQQQSDGNPGDLAGRPAGSGELDFLGVLSCYRWVRSPGQSVMVSSTGAPLTFSVSASSASWLSVSPASGTTGSSLSVTADPTGLAPGSYNGSITVTRRLPSMAA